MGADSAAAGETAAGEDRACATTAQTAFAPHAGTDVDRSAEHRGRARPGGHCARPGRAEARRPDDLFRVPALQPGVRPRRGRWRRASGAAGRSLLRLAAALRHHDRNRRVRRAVVPPAARADGARLGRAHGSHRPQSRASHPRKLHHLRSGPRGLEVRGGRARP